MTDGDRRLWYDEPAGEWVEALPVGNGRLGGMVHGRPGCERVQANEETLWAGGHADRTVAGAAAHLPEIREHLFAGDYETAERLCNERLVGDPPGIRPYQPFCDLRIETDHAAEAATNYRRELDLREAVVRVSYDVGETTYTREYFASAPDDVLVVRLEADGPGTVEASVSLDREREARSGTDGADECLLRGQVLDLPNVADMDQGDGGWGLRFEGRARVRVEGSESHETGEGPTVGPDVADEWGEKPTAVEVSGADAATVLFAAATDYDGPEPPATSGRDPTDATRTTLDAAARRSYADLRARHVRDHRELFDRMSIDLGESVDAPTDERLAAVREGADDPDLAALYFQYGRYLLAASSRPGTLPANLQGIWNEDYDPAWHACYTLDVNLEMNYWHAETTNLRECAEPLVSFVDSLRESGRATAREHYDCRGFCAHVDTDLWRTTTQSVDARWGYWPMAAAWLSHALWERYAFSGDPADLEAVYPALREAARFLLDFLVEHPEEGSLVTAPSASPENRFHTPDGGEATVCVTPTMDIFLARDLFAHCIEAAEELDRAGEEAEFVAELRDALDRLPPVEVTDGGRLREWLHDFEAVDPGHRHVSHLVGLYPFDRIGVRSDPGLAAAARASLEDRLANGGGHTGWSCAWTIALFARLEDGECAHEHVRELLAESTYDSLLDAHPPFQIDGNFGGCAGIAEMLLGSHGGELRLLPALPEAWPEGSVDGLRARGGYEVGIEWSEGSLDRATVAASREGECRVRTFDVTVERVEVVGDDEESGGVVPVDRPEEGVVVFPVDGDEKYRLVVG